MSLFDAIGGLGAIYGFDKGIERTRELGETAYNRGETAAASVAGQTEFKPFTVTSGVGGAQFDQIHWNLEVFQLKLALTRRN